MISDRLYRKQYTTYIKSSKSAKGEINSVKANRSPKVSFDKWCGKTCGKIKTAIKIKDCYNKVNGSKSIITNGNAQKWLNMVLKYLWLLGALPNDIKEERLHAPIDSYILQKLWNLKADGVICSADAFYYKGNSWSKISDYDDYFDLQKVIRVMAK